MILGFQLKAPVFHWTPWLEFDITQFLSACFTQIHVWHLMGLRCSKKNNISSAIFVFNFSTSCLHSSATLLFFCNLRLATVVLCHPPVRNCVVCVALLLFFMNYPQLPKLVRKLNCEGISSIPEMILHIFIFLTSVVMWEIILLPVSSDVNSFGTETTQRISSEAFTLFLE